MVQVSGVHADNYHMYTHARAHTHTHTQMRLVDELGDEPLRVPVTTYGVRFREYTRNTLDTLERFFSQIMNAQPSV